MPQNTYDQICRNLCQDQDRARNTCQWFVPVLFGSFTSIAVDSLAHHVGNDTELDLGNGVYIWASTIVLCVTTALATAVSRKATDKVLDYWFKREQYGQINDRRNLCQDRARNTCRWFVPVLFGSLISIPVDSLAHGKDTELDLGNGAYIWASTIISCITTVTSRVGVDKILDSTCWKTNRSENIGIHLKQFNKIVTLPPSRKEAREQHEEDGQEWSTPSTTSPK
jgi:hypothetical protein